MKENKSIILSVLFLLIVTMNSCDAIAGIFKAGIWTGVIIIALVVGLILFLVGKAKK